MNFWTYGTDKAWEWFGKSDPYYGVISNNEYRKGDDSVATKEKFFRSGATYVDRMLDTIRTRVDSGFELDAAIDFGCGVGRIAIPLARKAQWVTGFDVSQSMLTEAEKNCAEQAVNNIELLRADDDLRNLSGTHNLIHSYIVFQHISTKRGTQILSRLVDHLLPGGVGVVHFTYAKNYRLRRYIAQARRYVPGVGPMINLVKRRELFEPQMQMNCYNLNLLLLVLQRAGIRKIHTEFTDHSGELGVVLYFKKPA